MSKIVVIWDAMLDIYIFGNTDRKNPESPMPLLKVEKQDCDELQTLLIILLIWTEVWN